ncbi:MAG: protein-disulfide reductase DsbD domain-containing protein [Planctomycetota bacterium]
MEKRLLISFVFLAIGWMPGTSLLGQSGSKQVQDQKPYNISSRIHLQQGTNRGYLVVQMELAKGNYVYSLTQKGDIPATKIKVKKSSQFRQLDQFHPDRPAKVIQDDPIFGQRVEKHMGKIQFFAPIEVAGGVTVSDISVEVELEGQVCSDEGYCLPIRGSVVRGKFAGYFQRPVASTASRSGPRTTVNSGTVRR